MRLLGWVQQHFITNYEDQRVLSHSEAVEQLLAIVDDRKVPRFYDAVAGELHPTEEPCSEYRGDGRSDICADCDWPDEAHDASGN